MNVNFKTAASAILTVALVATAAYASDPAPKPRKHVATKKAATPKPPSVQDQIKELRDALDAQGNKINSLQTDLSAKDAQLKRAEQEASEAKAEAAKAEADATAQQQSIVTNAAAVTTLQTTVT